MKNLKTKKLSKKICLALACGLVFTAGGQLSEVEAADSPTLYGAESGTEEGVRVHEKGVSKSVPEPRFLSGANFEVFDGNWSFVYGGYISIGSGSETKSVYNNTVTISGGTVSNVLGGRATTTEGGPDVNVYNNIVNIFGGKVTGSVYGGLANSSSGNATASGNTVTISGGTVSNVYGGYAKTSDLTATAIATASGNTVEIFGGNVTGNVYGGYAEWKSGSNRAKAEKNTVTLGNKTGAGHADITGNVYINATKNSMGSTIVTQNGGTLNVYNVGNKVEGSLYAPGATVNFYVPQDIASDATLLTAQTADFSGSAIKINGLPLTKITLIKTNDTGRIITTGETKYYVGDIEIDPARTRRKQIITDNKDYLLIARAALQVNTSEIKYEGTPVVLAGSIIAMNDEKRYAGGRTSGVVIIDADTFIPIIEGTEKCQIVGAVSFVGATAKDGTIDLKATRDLSDFNLWGGISMKPDQSFGPVSGNTLNVRALNIKANSIQNFDALNFYVPKTAVNGDTMLAVKTATIDGATIHAGVSTGSGLKKNDIINLLAADTLTGTATSMKADLIGTGMVKIDGTVKKDGNNIVLVMNEDINNELAEESKSLAETRAGGMAFLNSAADMAVGKGFMSAQAAAEAESNAQTGDSGTRSNEAVRANAGFTPYAAVGAANMTYETGSYVDSKGWGINVGLSRIINNKNSKLTLAPFIEYGKSSYDSYLENDVNTHGSGDSSFTGIGFMAKNEQKDGLYYEGSVRLGRSKGDYQGDASTYNSKYDTASNYLAFHAGIGKVQKLNDKSSLDYYGKLFYTHQNGDTVNIQSTLGDASYDFDAINSYRLRLGTRWNQKLSARDVFYAGIAWDYEFDSEARAHYNGMSTPAPSMKGSSGMLELGWKQEATKENPFGVDLGLTGWCGKQRGISFNAGFSWAF